MADKKDAAEEVATTVDVNEILPETTEEITFFEKKTFKNLKVKNVKIKEGSTHTRVSLILEDKVYGFDMTDETPKLKKDTDVIFTSTYAISGIMKTDDDMAFAGDYIIDHPDALRGILSRATVNVEQIYVPAGTEYRNSASKDAEPVVWDEDKIISNVTEITNLSVVGKKGLDKVFDIIMS